MTERVLKLDRANGFARKVAINVLNKNADYTLFTWPIEGIALTSEELDAFMGQYTFRSWYDQKADNSWHPCTWWETRTDGSFHLDGRLQSEAVTLHIEGKDYTFEQYNADEEGEDDDEGEDVRPGGRIGTIVLKPTAGGTTLLSFHLTIRPELGKQSTALLAHQFRNIAVTFEKASSTATKAKQQDLPLSTESIPDDTGHQSPPPIVSQAGEALDQAHHASHPEGAAEVMGADKPLTATELQQHQAEGAATMDPVLEADVKQFEAAAQARLDEFKSRAANAVDGTTMRSRRRRRSEDATH